MKVVFHINDPERWGLALRNAHNLMEHCQQQQEPCQVELVANGAAVRMLKKEDAHRTGFTDGLRQMVEHGLSLCACGDSMQMLHVPAAELLDGVTVVPLGVAEMARLQAEGYAYIKV